MNYLIKFGMYVYSYCTDFIINLSNLSNLSYYEINFIFFCVIYPSLLLISIILFITSKLRLSKYKK